MTELSNVFFSDLSGSANLENSLQYLAAGIVESKHFDDKETVSGKDCVYQPFWCS